MQMSCQRRKVMYEMHTNATYGSPSTYEFTFFKGRFIDI